MILLAARLSVLRKHLNSRALAAVFTAASGLIGAPAFANPDPQPSANSIPLAYNADQPGANTSYLPVTCPLGQPGVPQACTGQITVRAQPISVGYLDWHMDGPPIVSAIGGTISYATTAADSCAVVPSNPSGAEPSVGFCTLTGFVFTPDASQSPASLAVSITWTEQSPDDVNPVQYTPTNPLLSGTNTITVPLSGTPVVSSTTLNCMVTAQNTDSLCDSLTVTAQGGPIQIPTGGSFLTQDESTDFSIENGTGSGSCVAGALIAQGASCTTSAIHFTPKSDGTFIDNVTLTTLRAPSVAIKVTATTSMDGTPLITSSDPNNFLNCSPGAGTPIGGDSACGVFTVTSVGGSLQLPFDGSFLSHDEVDFDGSDNNFTPEGAGTCTPGLVLLENASCITPNIHFVPQSGGIFFEELNFTFTTSSAFAFLEGFTPTDPILSPTSITCPNTQVGQTSSCGTITLADSNSGTNTLVNTVTISDTVNYSISAGTCVNTNFLAGGATCQTGEILFTPTIAGALPTQVSFNTTWGDSAVPVTVTGTGTVPPGTLVPSVPSIDCGSVGVGVSASCNTGDGITLVATGGPVQLNTDASSLNVTPGEFSVPAGSCTAGLILAAGGTCTTGPITFLPDAAQSFAGSVSFGQLGGAITSIALSGQGVYGTLALSVASIDCNVGFGLSSPCNGGELITVTATNGPVQLAASAAVTAQPSGTYSIDPGTCTLGLQLSQNQSCTTGVITFSPAAAQSYPGSVTFTDVQSNGVSVALTGAGLTYAWNQAGFGACTSALPSTWVYSAYAPTTGCGLIPQTRTGTCTAGAGTKTQIVSCQSTDGTIVADTLCASSGTKPAASQSCTVTAPGTNCGTEGTLTQSATLLNDCPVGGSGGGPTGPAPGAPSDPGGIGAIPGYSWSGGCTSFGACTGGTGAWTPSSWTPAKGSACTEHLNQTRTVPCIATPGSGLQACTAAQCEDSNGNPAPASSCGSLPGGQACTPTSVSCTGSQPALAQTVIDHGACGAPSWIQGGFGGCTGGTSSSGWTPTTGCGVVTQTSTCAPTAGSGTQTQAVTCQLADGAIEPDSNCAGTPVTSQACTPDASICGAPQTRQQTLSSCASAFAPCVSNPAQAQFCVIVPLH